VAPPEDVRVRPAGRADLLAVSRIENASFEQPWPYAAFDRLLDAAAFLVADRNGGVVGYVVGDVTPNAGRDIGHVKDIAVHPDARKLGIGRLLLRSSLVRLRAAGAVVAKLEVRESNEPARGLYRGEGFEPARRAPRYYDDGEDAVVMTVDLTAWSAGRSPARGARE
jgi:ribosomal-protein-alanine N-acetyltransferase